MEAFVLIVTAWTWASNGGNAVSMQEFSTLARCESAREKVLVGIGAGAAGYTRAVCVPK